MDEKINTTSSGCGMSFLSERIIESQLKEGYKVIYVCDIKNDLEGAFSMFKPKENLDVKKDLEVFKNG